MSGTRNTLVNSIERLNNDLASMYALRESGDNNPNLLHAIINKQYELNSTLRTLQEHENERLLIEQQKRPRKRTSYEAGFSLTPTVSMSTVYVTRNENE